MAKAVKESASSIRYSDITLSTGLTFSTDASNNTVKLYNVLGSTQIKGCIMLKVVQFTGTIQELITE